MFQFKVDDTFEKDDIPTGSHHIVKIVERIQPIKIWNRPFDKSILKKKWGKINDVNAWNGRKTE